MRRSIKPGEDSFLKYLPYLVASSATTLTDEVAMTISLPYIQADFKLDAVYVQWVYTAFWLGTAAAAIPFARLASRVGVISFLMVDFSLFVASYLAMFFVTNFYVFVVLRFVAGCITAGLISNRNFIVSTYCSPDRRQNNINKVYILNSVVYLISPVIGALATYFIGWRWIFIICACYAAISGLTLICYANPPKIYKSFDILGSLLIAWSSAALCAALTFLAGQKWYVSGILLVLCICGCVALVFQERRFANPIIPTAVVYKPIGWIIVLNLLNYIILGIKTYIIPQYINYKGLQVMVTALITAGSCLLGIGVAVADYVLAQRFVYRHILVVVYALLCSAMIVFFFVFGNTIGFIVMVFVSSLFILSAMMLTYPMLMYSVPQVVNEIVSGLPTTSRTIGNSLAFCIASCISFLVQNSTGNIELGYQAAIPFSVALALAAALISAFLIGNLVTEHGKRGFTDSKTYNREIWCKLQRYSAGGDAEALIAQPTPDTGA